MLAEANHSLQNKSIFHKDKGQNLNLNILVGDKKPD